MLYKAIPPLFIRIDDCWLLPPVWDYLEPPALVPLGGPPESYPLIP